MPAPADSPAVAGLDAIVGGGARARGTAPRHRHLSSGLLAVLPMSCREGLSVLVACAGLVLAPGLTLADSPGMTWDELSAEQQQVLAPLADQWREIAPQRRARLAAGAQRWADMDPAERVRAEQGMHRWRERTPEQRRKMREHMMRFHELPAEEQARLRQNFERFRDLSPGQQKALRERWEKLTPEQRAALRERRGPRPHRHDHLQPGAQPPDRAGPVPPQPAPQDAGRTDP